MATNDSGGYDTYGSAVPSSLDLGVDSSALIGGSGGSVWDDAAGVVTQGLPLAARSAYLSFKNMPADIGNWFGMDNHIETMKESLGEDAVDAQAYYAAHAQGIDVTGLIGGSFIPGLGVSKLLSAGKIVSAIKAGKIATDEISVATGLLPAVRRAQVLKTATSAIEADVTAYSAITADTLKASLLGIADQALQAAAWETATIATMHANPALSSDGLGDSLQHIAFAGVTGGLFMSPFSILGSRSTLNTVRQQMEELEKGHTLLKSAGASQLVAGDRVAQTVASVWDHEFLNPATSAAGKTKSDTRAVAAKLDIIQKLNSVSDDADVANRFVDFLYEAKQRGVPLVSTGSEPGVLDHVLQAKGIHRANNPDLLTDVQGSFYLNIHTPATVIQEGSLTGVPNWTSASFDPAAKSSKRFVFADSFDQSTFRRAAFGDPLSPQISAAADKLAPNATAAWEAGFHTWSDADGVLHLNPDAKLIGKNGKVLRELPLNSQMDPELAKVYMTTGKMPESYEIVRYDEKLDKLVSTTKIPDHVDSASVLLNVKTGDLSKDGWLKTGDIASVKINKDTGKIMANSPVKLVNEGNSLEVAGTVYNYGLQKTVDLLKATNLRVNNAYSWAWLRGLRKGDSISVSDLPMLEAAVYHTKDMKPEEISKLNLSLRDVEGGRQVFPVDAQQLQDRVVELKKTLLRDLTSADSKVTDAADIATRVNAPVEWIRKGGMDSDFALTSVHPQEHLEINHVRINYDVSPMAYQADANIARGVQGLQYRIDATDAICRNVFNGFVQDKNAAEAIYVRNKNSASATTERTEATAFAHADASYSTLANRLQFAGKAVLALIEKANNEAVEYMTPHFHALMGDTKAGTELAFLRNAHLRMGEKFAFLDTAGNPSLKKQVEELLGRELAEGEKILVPRKSIGEDKLKNVTWDQNYKPKLEDNPTDHKRFVTATELGALPGGASSLEGDAKALGMYTVSPKVANFLTAQQALNDQRLLHANNFFAATGNARKLEQGNVYFPPVNTHNYPYVAFVRQRDGLGGGTSTVAAVVGKDADDLAQKMALVKANHPELDVYSSGQSKEYYKARGDYDYNLNLTDNDVNTMLHRKGILVDYSPNARPETTLADYAQWNQQQITRLHRNYAEMVNGQLYSELELMGKQYEWVAKSRVGKGNQQEAGMSADNPYQMLKFQGLGINPRVNYTLWNSSQDKVEALFTTAFNKARSAFGDASKGLIDFTEANKIARNYGLGDPYGSTVTAIRNYQVSSGFTPTPMLEKFVRTANSIQTALAIRLDQMQSLINLISTPILMWPEAMDAAKKLGVIELPGREGVGLLGFTKHMAKNIGEWHSSDPVNMALKQEFFDRGILTTKISAYHDLINDLTLRGGETSNYLSDKISSAVDKTSKLIGSDFSEQFGRYMPAKLAHDIFSAAGQTGEELWSNVNTFVARVHGCSVAAQRPIAFQGPIGAAIGLFQTYQFNFMQQVFRHAGEGNYKALALLAGLQSTLYGMQGLPGFNFINQTIIGNAMGNPAHSDIYSSTKSFLGDKLGDFALYGGASNLLQAGIYTRGDVNPRSMTVLPVNPLDIPTVSSGLRAIQNVYDMGKKLQDGDSFWNTFTQGLEHNAMSRPVSGFGQLLQGFSTTSKGSLISANRPGDTASVGDFFNVANAMRLVGARPLDEAVIMDASFRRTAYQAADSARMATLGEAVKDTIRKGAVPSDEQMATFVSKYSAAGGYVGNFGKSMIDWTKDANTSVANEVYKKLQTPALQNLQLVMGGKRLPDFATAPLASASSPANTNPASVATATPVSSPELASTQSQL